jgi:hypothetical protein
MVYHFKYLAKDDKDEEQFDLIVGEWNFDAWNIVENKYKSNLYHSQSWEWDHPLAITCYILDKGIRMSDGKYISSQYSCWACGFIHQVNHSYCQPGIE